MNKITIQPGKYTVTFAGGKPELIASVVATVDGKSYPLYYSLDSGWEENPETSFMSLISGKNRFKNFAALFDSKSNGQNLSGHYSKPVSLADSMARKIVSSLYREAIRIATKTGKPKFVISIEELTDGCALPVVDVEVVSSSFDASEPRRNLVKVAISVAGEKYFKTWDTNMDFDGSHHIKFQHDLHEKESSFAEACSTMYPGNQSYYQLCNALSYELARNMMSRMLNTHSF